MDGKDLLNWIFCHQEFSYQDDLILMQLGE